MFIKRLNVLQGNNTIIKIADLYHSWNSLDTEGF